MNASSTGPHRWAVRLVARTGTVLSAVMLLLSIIGVGGGSSASAAATNAGPLVVAVPPGGAPLNSGGSATEFSPVLPLGAACSGDSATGGYRVTSYMVPASVDPSTLTFDGDGPIPGDVGVNLRQPLFSPSGGAFLNVNTAISTGVVTNLTTFSFARFGSDGLNGAELVPPGTYNIGLACIHGTRPGPDQLDRYWNAQLTFAAEATDVPAGLTWRVAAETVTTTSTTTTLPPARTTLAPATSTTAPRVTPTTTGPTTTSSSTSSTTPSASTSTSTSPGSSTSSTAVVSVLAPVGVQPASGSGSGSSSGSTAPSTLPSTGTTIWPVLVWGLVLLVFGRMALLIGRPIRVRRPK